MRRVRRIIAVEDLAPYQASMGELLKTHRSTLLDDARRSGDAGRDTRFLLENTAACVPYLWLLVDEACHVWAIAALTDIQPGRHAFLHGVSHSASRNNPGVNNLHRPNPGQGGDDIERTLLPVLQAAFGELKLLKLKAEFEADNAGAKGFCLRLGFRREALFEADVCMDGRLRDVAIYSLPAEQYRETLLPRLLRCLTKAATPSLLKCREPQGAKPCL